MLLSIDTTMPSKFTDVINNTLDGEGFSDNILLLTSCDSFIFPFTALRLETDGLISYFPERRLNDLKNRNETDMFSSSLRQKIRPGKMLRLISDILEKNVPDYKGIPSSEIEKVSVYIQSLISNINNTYDIKILEGDEISWAYNRDNYVFCPGSTLNLSCMSHCSDKFFDIYTKNPDQVKCMVVYENKKVIGRALIWYCIEDIIFMDRPYYGKEEVLFSMRNKAKEMKINFKENISSNQRVLIIDNGETINPIVILDEWIFKYYPYMDTLCYLDIATGRLSISPTIITGKGLILRNTDGGALKMNL